MNAALNLAIGMGALTIYFWYKELKPFLEAIEHNERMRREASKGKGLRLVMNAFTYSGRTINVIPKLIPLSIDLGITLWLAGALSLGGFYGTVIGLTMSNVVSIIILWRARKAGTERKRGAKTNKQINK